MANTRIQKEFLDDELTVGAASSTDNAIVRFDGTGGKTLQNSGVTIGDSNNVLISIADTSNVVGLTINQLDATNDKLALEINAKVSAGTAAKVTASTLVQYNDTNGANSDWSFNVAGNGAPFINLQKTGGTLASPTATTLGTVYSIDGYVYDQANAQKKVSSLYTKFESFGVGNEDSTLYIDILESGTLKTVAKIGYLTETYFYTKSGMVLSSDNSGATGPYLFMQSTSASPAAADSVGLIYFAGRDSGGGQNNYAIIKGVITDTTATSEDGKLVFNVITAGTNADELELTGAELYPTTSDGLALGSGTKMFSDLFLASGGVINFNNGNATLTHSAGLLTSNVSMSLGTSNVLTTGTIELGAASDTTLSRSAAGVLAVEGVVVPTISSTNTLTNKRITKRVLSTAGPGATPTINTDNYDAVHLTALAAAITSMTTNLTGTPVEGDMLRIDFTDNGTARAITWGTSFESSGNVTLPTTTVVSTRLDVGFVWNSVTSKWRCIAVA